MTVSTHTYRAALRDGSAVSIRSGSVSLNARRAPHVQSSVVLPVPGTWAHENIPNPLEAGKTIRVPRWRPQPAVMSALDPRRGARCKLTASDGTTQRVFNLGVREVEVDHDAATVAVSLASDEALLDDYAPIADDPNVWAGSVGHVVQYVLGRAGMPSNLEPNPRAEKLPATAAPYLSRWSWAGPSMEAIAGVPANSPGGTNITTMARFRSTETGSVSGRGVDSYGNADLPAPGTTGAWVESPVVTPGDTIAVSRHVRWYGLTAPAVSLSVRFHDGAGQWIGWHVGVDTQSIANAPAGQWRRLAGTVVVPPGAKRMVMRVVFTGPAVVTPNSFMDITGMQTEVNDEVTPYRDYALAINSADAPLPTDRAADLLIWRAGQSALDFLHPIVQAVGLRLVCDELRRWTLRNEGYTAPGGIAIRYGVNLIQGRDTSSRESEEWYDAAVVEHQWTDAAGNQQRQIDAYSSRPSPTKVRRFQRSTPFPGSGFALYAVRRAHGRGRAVTASAVSDWAAHAEQPIAVVLEGAETQTGLTETVAYDLTTDRMTVTTRTTDTPAGSIALLSGTVNALPGTVNSL